MFNLPLGIDVATIADGRVVVFFVVGMTSADGRVVRRTRRAAVDIVRQPTDNIY